MTIYMNGPRAALALSLLAMTAACGDGASIDNQAANNQAPAGNASAMQSGPFSEVETRMHERMMAATGANASETWLRKMIEHHRGAVEMSRILIDGGGDPDFVQMARTEAEKQQREIGELERMLSGGISGGSGEANPYGPVEQSMNRQMMAATGANLSETWARKMIAHHQGAVDMSEVLIRQGGDPQVVAMARRTAEDQRRDIAHLEAMLRGEPMAGTDEPAAPASQASGKAVAPAARQPAAAPKAAPRPTERDKAGPPPPVDTPEPAPPPAKSGTCTPEHAAMGHCNL